MKFRDIIINDIENIILNNDEFSTEHFINSTKVKCVVDNDMLEELKKKNTDGIIQGNVLIYISSKEMKMVDIIPKTEMLVSFDDKDYFIESVGLDEELYTLILRSNYD